MPATTLLANLLMMPYSVAMQYGRTFQSPLGLLYLRCNETQVTGLSFHSLEQNLPEQHPLLDEACQQLEEYFQGNRKVFSLPLLIEGTPFQKRVYSALLAIPYGQTASYETIALRIGNTKAYRAVGMANKRNRIALLLPCHRVVGKNGSLVGYEGGLDKKAWLIDFERDNR